MFDWRELKKELFRSPIRPRNSKTFEHTDVFNAKLSPRSSVQVNPTNQSSIGKITYRTPKRVRENDTTRSFVLDKSDYQKEERPQGKRTYLVANALSSPQPTKKHSVNPHRPIDHQPEWFFDQSTEPRRNLAAVKVEKPIPQRLLKSDSPHKYKKQQELYLSEVGRTNTLEPDSSKLDYQPRTSEKEPRCYTSLDCSALEKRILQNESNIFHQDQTNLYRKKTEPEIRERQTQKSAPSPQPLEFNPKEINRIKRINHNFSDVFGNELGAKESIQLKRQQNRALSPCLVWTKVDSIMYRKDHSQRDQSQSQQRSRIMDQKSTLDTHHEYEKPIPKADRLVTKKPVIERTKKKRW